MEERKRVLITVLVTMVVGLAGGILLTNPRLAPMQMAGAIILLVAAWYMGYFGATCGGW